MIVFKLPPTKPSLLSHVVDAIKRRLHVHTCATHTSGGLRLARGFLGRDDRQVHVTTSIGFTCTGCGQYVHVGYLDVEKRIPPECFGSVKDWQ